MGDEEEVYGEDFTSAVESFDAEGLLGPATSEEYGNDAPIPIGIERWEQHQNGVDQKYNDLVNYDPPDTGAVAQIILIVTSLGSFRKQFFGSKRAQHFLDCKGLVYHLIDANRDVSQGVDLKDQELLTEWSQRGLLSMMSNDTKFSIPQILVDGVSIGDYMALQDMEEDGDLDWVAVRAACPSCLNERDPNDALCGHCGINFMALIPEELVQRRQVQRFCRGQQYLDIMPTAQPLKYSEAIAHIDYAPVDAETLTYESLFGEPPPPEDSI